MAVFGDDLGDLPAFDAAAELGRRGWRWPGSPWSMRRATTGWRRESDLVVEGPAGAVALLEQLAQAAAVSG